MIPLQVTTLSQLVLWLADTYHGGRLYHVAKALKVSPGLVTQWKDETIKRPSDASLERLCAHYGLDFWQVMALTRRRAERRGRPRSVPIAGGSDPRKPKSPSDNARGLPRPGDGQKAVFCQVRPKSRYNWYLLPLAA